MPICAALLAGFGQFLFSECSVAQDSQPGEYQIKAAFIYNFAKFVEWPASSLPNPTSPLIIAVLGESPFGDALEKTVRNKTVEDHPLQVKFCQNPNDATNCHILFISGSEKARLPDVIKALNSTAVLTVADADHFNDAGGMINFIFEGTKIRFRINNEAATRAGLKISSKLLSLASR